MQATQAPSGTREYPTGTRYSPSTMGVLLPVSALRPGDVLLSCGTEALSQLIRRLDGGDYSHSALWDGQHAVDATGHGVVRRDLQEDMDVQWYIDAYRWHSPPPSSTDLGSAPYPYEPVIARNDRIVDAGTQFAYDELLMAAVVIALSKEPRDKWLSRSVRLLLSRVEQWVHDHIFTKPDTTAMTCAETVAVSFDEAAPPKYALEVEVDQSRDYETIAAAAWREGGGRRPNALSSYDAVKERYAELVVRAAPDTARGLQLAADARRSVRMNLPPGCVTPHDLQTSPSLTKLGRLSEMKTPPPSASESTLRLFYDLVREYWRNRPKTLSRR